MSIFKKVTAWLGVQSNRRKVYQADIALSPLLVASGFLSSGVAQTVLVVLGVAAGVGGHALAVKNTKKAAQ